MEVDICFCQELINNIDTLRKSEKLSDVILIAGIDKKRLVSLSDSVLPILRIIYE